MYVNCWVIFIVVVKLYIGRDEIFNLCHARLRNIIERTFSVIKVRFSIWKRMTPYSLVTQTKIFMACFSIHNFLQQVSVVHRLFSEYDTKKELESASSNQNQAPTTNNFFAALDQEFMLQF